MTTILTHDQFQKKLSALEELFEINLDRIQRAIYEAKKNGHLPTAIILPPVEFLGLPIKISPDVKKVTLEAYGNRRIDPSLGAPEKSS